MKKLIVSASVLVGVAVLGGGYLLWPNSSQQAAPVTSTNSATTEKVTSSSKPVAKKTTTAAASSASSAKSTSTTASQKTETSAAHSSHVTTSAAMINTGSSASSSSSAVETDLTTAQINDWVWDQLATEYQGTNTTKSDFDFQQTKKNDGLVYIEARENTNEHVSHLAGLFRVTAKGQLEKQNVTKGSDVWEVVSQAYR
ncbi:hypothetical protein RA086_10250 [Lactiplantibacillus sp. WILCCON 0030]|uniref:Lipoprotein n=1 Tax=Lactiplantibacillus brownii TaxID=3069269 RepID=A0ABU1AAK9_9LACO|nr:hypothetical protein [Lactiplantibacillus brownii]MDQ7937989.1 hypothetical protein [Lactiplantibacillus brownii]